MPRQNSTTPTGPFAYDETCIPLSARILLLGRVSSAQQKDGGSLDVQVDDGRKWLEQHDRGHCIVETLLDDDDSANPRNALMRQVYALGAAGTIDGVLIWKQDRLARGNKIHVALDYFEQSGLSPLCVLEPFSAGEIDVTVRGLSSGMEKKGIRLRTQTGRRSRVAAGTPLTGKRPKFGYTWTAETGKYITRGRFTQQPEEAAVVAEVYRRILEPGGSSYRVAASLDRDGIATRGGGRAWTSRAVREIITSPCYMGVALAYHSREVTWWEKGDDGKKHIRSRPRDPQQTQVVDDTGTVYPPIVSRAVWEAANAKLARGQAEAVKSTWRHEDFLLRAGFLFCGDCGYKAVSSYRAGVAKYRVVTSRERHQDCPGRSIGAAGLDAAVWAAVVEALSDEELLAAELGKLREHGPVRDELATLDASIASKKVAKARARKLAQLAEDEADIDGFMGDFNALGAQIAALEEHRVTVAARVGNAAAAASDMTALATWVRDARETLTAPDELDYATKRHWLQLLDVRVELWPEGHTPRWRGAMILSPGVEGRRVPFGPSTLVGASTSSRTQQDTPRGGLVLVFDNVNPRPRARERAESSECPKVA